MPDTTHPDRPQGWRLVLSALLAAEDRTLTNAQLGAIPGVQAFHQRLSDLKRRGWIVTPAKRQKSGYYAYKLLGYVVSTDAQKDAEEFPPEVTALASALTAFRDRETGANAARDALVLHADTSSTAKPPAPVFPSVSDAATVERIQRDLDRARAHAAEITSSLVGAIDADDYRNPVPPRLHSISDREVADEAVALILGLRDRVRSFTAALASLARSIDTGDEHTVTVEHESPEVIAAAAEEVIDTLRERPEPRARAQRAPSAPRGPSGPELMRRVLEAAGAPVHSKLLAQRVMEQGGDTVYKGKTPAATMAAQLATSNTSGGEFIKTTPGCYALREWPAEKLAAEPQR